MRSALQLILFISATLTASVTSAQTTAPTSAPTTQALSPQQLWWEQQRQPAGPQSIVRTHDPCAIFTNNAYYLFGTGRGTPISRSEDLYHWTRIGIVFPQQPEWAWQEVPGSRGQWAPDISFFDGVYHLYYSISTFGSRRSCIGLTINKSLDSNSPDNRWIDQGKVIETHNTDDYNAIDPNLIMDEHDQPWLVFGSCWDGIRITRLDRATGKPPAGEPPTGRLAHRPKGKLLEGPFVIRHGDWFYLFISFDACCKGADSTYNIRVGRSMQVDGPYADLDGVPMLEGGGSLVLGSYGNVRGPGHCGVLSDADGHQWMVHHYYDAAAYGLAKLQVRRIVWTSDSWPLVGEPVDRPITKENAVAAKIEMAGAWRYSVNFGDERPMRFNADGSIDEHSPGANWRVDNRRLLLAAGDHTDICEVDDVGNWFVGRDRAGAVIRGRRVMAGSHSD